MKSTPHLLFAGARSFAAATAFVVVLAATGGAAAELPPGFKLEGTRWTCRDGESSRQGILVKPEGDGPFPAILISHGRGGNAEGFGAAKAREFVKMGFVCIATSYTHAGPVGGANATEAGGRGKGGAPGRAPKGQAGPGKGGGNPAAAGAGPPPESRDGFGASEENLRRASTCLDILAGLPFVDVKRVAAYGNSMGAFITAALAAKEQKRLKAAAITAGGIWSRAGAAAEAQAGAARVPLLILHGGDDRVVPPESSARLKEILDRNKVSNERHVFDGIGHNLHQEKAAEVNQLMRDWFVKCGVLEK